MEELYCKEQDSTKILYGLRSLLQAPLDRLAHRVHLFSEFLDKLQTWILLNACRYSFKFMGTNA